MPAIAPDYRKLIQIALPFAAALVIVSASRVPSQAETNHMLVIPASDGYGFDDCLSNGKACGHVIADAWCEAHGMTSSISFGRAEDITASIATKSSTGATSPTAVASATGVKPGAIEPGAFIVNCRD